MKKVISFMVISVLMLWSVGAMTVKSSIDEYELNIVDVTNGAEVRGITTAADAAWYATASYEEGKYMLMAEFQGLTDPEWDDFYEGWVVRKNPFAFWSTGKLWKQSNGNYVNIIQSDVDYSDYDFYVLTLEPNDGDSAPADHILEGDVVMAKMMHDNTMMKQDDAMMKDAMMDKPDMMKSGVMMKKELTPKQKALRKAVKERVQRIDSKKLDLDVISERIDAFLSDIDNKGLSSVKKARIIEVLEALQDVIMEMKMMNDTMMMEK